MKYQDVAFNYNAGYWDLSLGTDGDFSKVDSFDTAILLSAIGSNRRASADEVSLPQNRQGWIGDANNAVEYGSKLWILFQARLTLKTLNQARTYLEQAMQWFLDYNYADEVVINMTRTSTAAIADITLKVSQDLVAHKELVLWENTGA